MTLPPLKRPQQGEKDIAFSVITLIFSSPTMLELRWVKSVCFQHLKTARVHVRISPLLPGTLITCLPAYSMQVGVRARKGVC